MLQAIGAALPAAMAVALSPFPVIGVVLIVASPHRRRNGPLFALGWLIGLAAVAALVVLVFGGADDPDSASADILDWLRVVAGAGLIVAGIRKWLKRPRSDEDAPPPAWMASLDDASAGRALTIGLLLSAANPKNLLLTAAAAASIAELGLSGSDEAVAIAVYVVLASWTVIGAVAAGLAGGEGASRLLDSVRRFMVANATTIMVLVLLVLGAKVLGDGLAALDR